MKLIDGKKDSPQTSDPSSKALDDAAPAGNMPGHNAFLALCAFVAFLGLAVFVLNVSILRQSDARIIVLYGISAMSAVAWLVNRRTLLPWSVMVYFLILVIGFSITLASVGGNLRFPAFPFFYVVFIACALASDKREIAIMAVVILATILFFGIQEVISGASLTPGTNALFVTHLLTFMMLVIVANAASKSNALRETAEQSLELQRQATRDEAKLLADVVDSIEDTFSLWSPDGKLIFGNQSFYAVNSHCHIKPGLSYEDFVGKSVDARMLEIPNSNKEEFVAQKVANFRLQNPRDDQLKHVDGRVFSLSIQRLQNDCVVSMTRDITNDQINAHRLELATRSLTIWDWDILNDRLYFSPGFSERLGYSPAEFEAAKSGSMINLMHPDDVPIYREKLDRSLKDNRDNFVNEHRYKTRNGGYISFLAVGETSFNSQGEAVRFNGVLTDVTEQRDLEERLHQAQKMETIGQLTGGVAHDFNNILAVILGNFELIKDLTEKDDIEELTEAGISAARKGADLTRNMLSFARKSRLELEVFNLNDMVRDVQKWSATGVPENINLNVSLSEDLYLVEADPSLAQTALLNLILNARDAMPDGGALTVETANVFFEEDLVDGTGDAVPKGNYVFLAVSDTGSGISAENLARIYDPFYTTKPPGAGSGLGLSMVQGFTRQSGGFIKAYSEPGTGTTLQLFFPALMDRSPSPPIAVPAEIEPPRERKRILLAEDQESVLEVLVKILTLAGYDVRSAHSGDAAAELWQTDRDFDLLLTDVVMPGKLQGPLLARHIRQSAPDLPVVFMSGYAREATVHGNGLKAEDIRLMKPIGKRDLLHAVATALANTKDVPKA